MKTKTRFHVITAINKEKTDALSGLEQKLEKQNYSEYTIWNALDKEECERFMCMVSQEDIICWLFEGENYADETFETVNELFRNEDVDLIFGDDYLNRSISLSYIPQHNYKPDYSFAFLTNYNYIGNSVFVRAKYILDRKFERWNESIGNNYEILLSFENNEDRALHINQTFLIDNARFMYKDAKLIEEDRHILQEYFKETESIVRECGNRYIAEQRTAKEKVSLVVYLKNTVQIREYADIIKQRTVYSDFELIFTYNNDMGDVGQEGCDDFKVCECAVNDSAAVCLKKAAKQAAGEVYVFLSEGVFPGKQDWIERLLDTINLLDAGAVSTLVMNQDMTIRSAGICVSGKSVVDSVYSGTKFSQIDDLFYNAYCIRECSTVSEDILMVKKEDFWKIGGFSEEYDSVENSFYDFGFKLREHQKKCLYTPYSCVVNTENSRQNDVFSIVQKWSKYLEKDVFFNENMKGKYFGARNFARIYSKDKNIEQNTKKNIVVLADALADLEQNTLLHEILAKEADDTYVCVMTCQNWDGKDEITSRGIDVIADCHLLIGTQENVNFIEHFDKIYVLSDLYEEMLYKLTASECKIVRTYDNNDRATTDGIKTEYFGVKVRDHSADYQRLQKEKIDVIVPVYNGYDYLEILFKSIAKTKINYRLIVVNDCSPDERIKPFLEAVIKKEKDAVYIEHTQNKGFVRSVNDALLVSENHVAIVNTDVEVPEYWLERLMMPIIFESDIASTTPFTNSGSICSFPNFVEDNKIYMGRTVNEIDRVFERLLPDYTEIPTGVGFCMGMSKYAIRDIGVLDAEAFGKGYGEENDWCVRAIEHGYKNVHVNNLFVYHNHGGSFLPQEKQELLEKNLEILGKKHIYYHADVAKFVKKDPYEKYRLYAALKIAMDIEAKTHLYFSHNWAGGAISYLNRQKRLIAERGEKYVGIYYDEPSEKFWIEFVYASYQHIVKKVSLKDVMDFIGGLKMDEIIVSELISFPELYGFLEYLTKLKQNTNVTLKALMHDFYCICPSYTLTDNDFMFCGVPESEECRKCAQINRNFKSLPRDMEEWRQNWGKMLNACDEVVCFSNDSKRHLLNVYPKVKATVLPHEVDPLGKVEAFEKTTDRINIAIIGAINEVKGINIIKEMSRIAMEENRKFRFYVVGYTSEDIENENTIITGKYERKELPELMKKYEIDIVLIPSVWPETFSYTTQEAIMMELPLAVFNIGAPVERVEKYEKGLIIPEMNARCVLEKIEFFLKKRDW